MSMHNSDCHRYECLCMQTNYLVCSFEYIHSIVEPWTGHATYCTLHMQVHVSILECIYMNTLCPLGTGDKCNSCHQYICAQSPYANFITNISNQSLYNQCDKEWST